MKNFWAATTVICTIFILIVSSSYGQSSVSMDLFLFSVNWTEIDVSTEQGQEDFEVVDLICLLGGPCEPTDVTIWFVDNSVAPGGDGSMTNPYNSLNLINGADGDGDVDEPGDWIFLFEGSGPYEGGIDLEENQRLIGQGVDLQVGGQTLVPGSSEQTPVITNANGDGVTLANRTSVEGMSIDGTSGSGLLGDTMRDATIGKIEISNTGGSGINVRNASGAFVFTDMVSISNVNDDGIGIFQCQADFNFGSLKIDSPRFAGVDIFDYEGKFTVGGGMEIRNATNGEGFKTGRVGTSHFQFGEILIDSADSEGLDIADISGSFIVDGRTSVTNIDSDGINLFGIDGDITFADLLVDGITRRGINLSSFDGTFIASGSTTISNTGQGAIDIRGDGTVTFENATVTNPNTDTNANGIPPLAAIRLSRGASDLTYKGNVSQNENFLTVFAVFDHSGSATFEEGTITATMGGGLQFGWLGDEFNPSSGADGEYRFLGTVDMKGGEAGIDVVGPSSGSFAFGNTSIDGRATASISVKATGTETLTAAFDGATIIGSQAEGFKLIADTGSTLNATVLNSNIDSFGTSIVAETVDGDSSFCLNLNGNTANNGYALTEAGGVFAVQDLANVETNNSGSSFNFLPSKGDFEDSASCP